MKLTTLQHLDGVKQHQLPLASLEGLEDVVHDAHKGKPCCKGNADDLRRDVGEEEADDIHLGGACLVEGLVRDEVWQQGSLEGSVGGDDAGQSRLWVNSIVWSSRDAKVGDMELMGRPDVRMGANIKSKRHQAYLDFEIVLELDGDGAPLRPWAGALIFTESAK